MKLKDLTAFVQGYLTAAYWTNDDSAPSGEYSTARAEKVHAKLSPESLSLAVKTCRDFCENNSHNLHRAGNPSQNGHDLWLTRNRNGSGFWDRGYPDEIGDALTAAAHALGESDLYTGDDGRLYFSR